MNRFDDEMSTTNVSLIDDAHTSRPLMASPLSIASKKPLKEHNDGSESPSLKPKDYVRNGSLALKHQEHVNEIKNKKKTSSDFLKN